jgi:hypothetical protein
MFCCGDQSVLLRCVRCAVLRQRAGVVLVLVLKQRLW